LVETGMKNTNNIFKPQKKNHPTYSKIKTPNRTPRQSRDEGGSDGAAFF